MQSVWGKREAYNWFWWGNLRARDHFCECGNEPSGFIKFGEILNYLKTV